MATKGYQGQSRGSYSCLNKPPYPFGLTYRSSKIPLLEDVENLTFGMDKTSLIVSYEKHVRSFDMFWPI